jgi:hypothetical protein
MKTINALLATITIGVFAFLSAATSLAGDGMSITPLKAEKKAYVKLESPKSIDVAILVSDEKGRILFEETIQSPKPYGRVYDFTRLSDGIYTISSHDNYINTISKVEVKHAEVAVLSNEIEYKPVFQTKDNALLVNYFNSDAKDITFSIEDKYGVLYENAEGNDQTFQKRVNTSKMFPGRYFATVNVGDRSYGYDFYVR